MYLDPRNHDISSENHGIAWGIFAGDPLAGRRVLASKVGRTLKDFSKIVALLGFWASSLAVIVRLASRKRKIRSGGHGIPCR